MLSIKDFLLNKVLGRILVRVAASLCAYLASGQIGVVINVDPNQVHALLEMLIHPLISKLKPRE